ncbi:MAG: hypothetical protein AAF797_07910 [Planctomycetota bacterium]
MRRWLSVLVCAAALWVGVDASARTYRVGQTVKYEFLGEAVEAKVIEKVGRTMYRLEITSGERAGRETMAGASRLDKFNDPRVMAEERRKAAERERRLARVGGGGAGVGGGGVEEAAAELGITFERLDPAAVGERALGGLDVGWAGLAAAEGVVDGGGGARPGRVLLKTPTGRSGAKVVWRPASGADRVAVWLEPRGRGAAPTLEFVSFGQRRSLGAWTAPAETELADVSVDGRRVLLKDSQRAAAGRDAGRFMVVDTTRPGAASVVKGFEVPGQGVRMSGYLVGEDGVMVVSRDRLTVWSLPGLEGRWSVGLPIGSVVTVSADRRWVVVRDWDGLRVLDAATGQTVGGVRGDGASLRGASVNPGMTRLAVFDGATVTVMDPAAGALERVVYRVGLPKPGGEAGGEAEGDAGWGSGVEWLDDRYALVGRAGVFDAEAGRFVMRLGKGEQGAMLPTLASWVHDQGTGVGKPGLERAGFRVGRWVYRAEQHTRDAGRVVAVAERGEVVAGRGGGGGEGWGVGAGSEVVLRVSLRDKSAEPTVEAGLRSALADAGHREVDAAGLELLAEATSESKQRRFGERALGSLEPGKIVTVTETTWNYTLRLRDGDGRVLWEGRSGSGGLGDRGITTGGGGVAGEAAERGRFNASVFERIVIPRRVVSEAYFEGLPAFGGR